MTDIKTSIVQHKFYRQITVFVIFIFPTLLFAQENNINKKIVYQNNNIVGYLYSETSLNCEDCYTLDTLIILGRKTIIQTETEFRGYNDGKQVFYPRFFIELVTEDDKAILKFNSTTTSDTYWLSIKKEKSDNIYIYEEFMWYPNASVDIEISENDFTGSKCSHICRKSVYKLIDKKIAFTDYFMFNDDSINPGNECFNCPIKYSLDECLEKGGNSVYDWQ